MNELEKYLKSLQAKGFLGSDVTLDQFKNMVSGRNAKSFFDQVSGLEDSSVENQSLLTDELKDYDTYLEYFDIDTSFEVDDTKIEPLKSPYPDVDINQRPEALDYTYGDRKNIMVSNMADETAKNRLVSNYETKREKIVNSKDNNKTKQLKQLKIDFDEQMRNIELGSLEKNALSNIVKYKGTNEVNPNQPVYFPDYDPNEVNPYQVGFAPKKIESKKGKQGIHSWMFPEMTTNYLAGKEGMVDYNAQSTNNLWSRSREGEFFYADEGASDKSQNLLVDIIKGQYPGYDVRPYEKATKPVYEKDFFGVDDHSKRAVTSPSLTGVSKIDNTMFGEKGVQNIAGTEGGTEMYSYRYWDDGSKNPIKITGEELIITSPDGKDEISIFTEVGIGTYTGSSTRKKEEENRAIEGFLIDQKVKLANFVNEHGGIDLSRVNTGKSNLLSRTANLVYRPANVKNPAAGGIAPNEQQAKDLLSIGKYNEEGEFTPNPMAFATNNELVVQYIIESSGGVSTPGISEATLKNPNSREATAELKKWAMSFEKDKVQQPKQEISVGGNYQTSEGLVYIPKGQPVPRLEPVRAFGGEDTPLPYKMREDYKQHVQNVKDGLTSATWNAPIYETGVTNLSEALSKITSGRGLNNPYRATGFAKDMPEIGPGSAPWLQATKELEKAFEGTDQEIPKDLIASSVAQQQFNKTYDEIRDGNLKEYLWSADNDNYRQQLLEYYNINTRDKSLVNSMALMAVNQADLIEFSGDNAVNTSVNNFEETYNDPTAEFALDENQAIISLRNGKRVNKSTYDTYIKARTTKQNQLKSMLETRNKVWKLQDEQSDIDANLNLLGKEYDAWNSSIDALGLGFADIGTGLLYLAGKAVKYASPFAPSYYAGATEAAISGDSNFMSDFWDSWDEQWADKYDDYARWKTNVKNKYGEEVSFHSNKYGQGGAFTNGTNFGRFVGMEVGKQIPILATMVATGGTAAPWVIGAYSAGQHWAEGDLREFHSGVAENEFIQGISAIGYGAAEGVFEALTTVPILKRGASLMQRSGGKSFLNYKNSMKQYFKENALHLASDPVMEASSEFMTSIAQNAIDGRPLLENADHAAFVGGMFGFGMSTSPFLAGAIARQFTDYDSFAEFKKKDDAVREAQIALDYLKGDGNISEESLAVQEKALNDLRQEQKDFVATKFGAIENTMGGKAYDSFMENTRIQANKSAAANEMISAGVSNKIIQEVKKDFDMHQLKADIWRTNGNFGNSFTLLEGTDRKRYDRLWQQAKSQLAKENNGKIRDDQIPRLAEELYLGEEVDANFKEVSSARKSNKKKYLKFDTNGEGLTYIDDVLETSKEIIQNDNTLTDEQKKAEINDLEENVRGFKDGISDDSAMGSIARGSLSGWNLMFDKRGVLTTNGDATVRNEILGFRENAIKNNETQIFTHEASHAEFGEILGYDSQAFEPLAQDVKKYLQETHPDIWEAMVVRRGSELNKADEIVMNFLEYVGKGDIDLDNKAGKLMGSSFGFNVNNIFKKNRKSNLDLKGANESIQYLYDLGKAISEGKVNRGMISEYKKKAVFKEMRDNYKKAKKTAEKEANKAKQNKALKSLKKELENFKFSDTKEYDSAADILKELNNLVSSNKVKPVKNYQQRVKKLTERFQQLKKDAGIVDKVPEFKGKIEDESDAARKERVNLIERSFRGRLESFRGGKPMEEIVKAYEHKIETLFKKGGYFATDSYQGFDSFKEALEEFTLLVNAELMKSIRAFDATKNNDFDAYIMSPTILTNKVKLANKKIGSQNKNQGFNVGLEAASSVATSENTTVAEIESTLRELLGVKKTDPFYGAAMTAVQDVMQEGLPKFEYTQRKKKGKGETVTLSQVKKTMATNPTGEVRRQAERDLAGIYQNVRSTLESKYQKALDKSIKKEFLNTKNYNSFLKNHRGKLMRMLDISNLVALERLAKGDKILTKVVKKDLSPKEVLKYEGSGNLKTATTTQGPTLYSRLNPSEKQFTDFFNVRGRKDALAKILSAHLGLDATMQNLTSEKVVNEIAGTNPEIKEELGQQTIKDFAAAIKRGTSFKFSLSETVGIEGKLAEDYKELQPALLDQIINMEVSDPMSVKLAVDVVYSDEKFAPHRSKIKNVFEKLLKPYRKAIAQEGKVDIDLLEYVQSVDFALELESIAKTWNPKWKGKSVTAAEAFANENITDYQKAAVNRAAQQMLINNDNNVEQTALQFIRWQAFAQNGTTVNTKSARGMLYGDIANYKNEFLSPNFNIKDYKFEGSKMDRTITLEYNDGTFSQPLPFPPSPTQTVEKSMIDNTMSKEDIAFREKMAEDAWNFSVDIYKAAKQLYNNGGFDNLNMAMLMTGMGSAMKGPIRAAAPFRYAPVDINVTELRKGKGKFKDGIFTTKQRELANRVQKRINEEIGTRFEYIELPNGNIEMDLKNVDKNTEKELKKIIKEETGKNFEYEHGIPASVVNLLMVDAIFNKDSNVDLQKLKDSYAVGAIPVDMNDNMSIFFGDRMQFGYQVGDIAPMRWFNRFTRGGASYAVEDVRTGDRFGEKEAKLWESIKKAEDSNKYSLSNDVVDMSNLNQEEILSYASTIDAALNVARDPNAPVKKIRVFDFDDTLARTKSNVLYTMPDGTTGKLTAEEFAQKGDQMLAEGAVWDFSEFNKVMDGKKGPLFNVAQKIQEARGTDEVFVLTARSQEASTSIKQFLDSIGLNIPIRNITGLGNSSPYAKSQWVIEKAAEGYNDFYFADDHTGNVDAVKEALDVIDVKSKVQQAKFKFSENVDEEFNQILEHSLGIEWYKDFSAAKGKILGAKNQKFKLHPFSAEDFEGLLYPLLGKGRKGETAYSWFDEHLLKPYTRGLQSLSTARINLIDDYTQLQKDLIPPKTLKKENETGFTNENSARVYAWTALGFDIPGLSSTDLKEINDFVSGNADLKLFAESLLDVSKGDYPQPSKDWLGGTIGTDLLNSLNTIKRAEYLSQWKQNVDIIFSEKNLNKLEAALGEKYVDALKNIIKRMESGSNRLYTNSKIADNILNYLNNAQGVVMFLNMRSALLQGISAANFLNWDFNNPLKAGKAFGDQPQYWKDFMELMNSEYLVDRRNGLKMNLQDAEIANVTKNAKNKAKAAVSYIIEKGYTPTKFMDSFAIASGGSTWYRNRINDLIKNEGKTEAEAKSIAMEEFVEISEKSQQSSDPSKTSSQQASTAGRLMLNWANTQMQYVRIQKKAIQDIANGRGDTKSNVSKILYYGVIQNLWFNAAHTALFALAFSDDDEGERDLLENEKVLRTVNGSVDSILRGLGIGGHVVSVLKNFGMDLYDRSQRPYPKYQDAAWQLIRMTPVVYSKVSRMKQALWQMDSKDRRQEMIDKGFDIDNPAYDAAAKVISATTNIPLDRLLLKVDNIRAAVSSETEVWMKIGLLLGWPEWTLKDKKSKKEKPKWGQAKKSTQNDNSWGKATGGYKKESNWGKAVTQ